MTSIPAPSGQYGVGCVDLMHQAPGDEQGGLLVRLFYPSSVEEAVGCHYARWLPHERYVKAYTEMAASIPGAYLSDIDTKDPQSKHELLSVITATVMAANSPAVYGAPIIAKAALLAASQTMEAPPISPALLPVIIFSHGLATMRTFHSGVCCDLASHGYVVAAVEHRDGSAFTSHRRIPKPGSDSSSPQYQDDWMDLTTAEETFQFRHGQVLQRVDDVQKSLNLLQLLNDGTEVQNMMEGYFDFQQFKDRMDTGAAAVMGHSFGGATTIQVLSEDSRFRCGIVLDCWMMPIQEDLCASGTQQPLLFINSKCHVLDRANNLKVMLKMVKPPDESGISTCRILTLKGTHHCSQADLPFVLPDWAWEKIQSELDPAVAHAVNMEICHDFLKRYFLQDPAYKKAVPNLDGVEGHSEHILFGADLNVSDGLCGLL